MEENINLFDHFLIIGLSELISKKKSSELTQLTTKDLEILSIFPSEKQPEYLQNLKYWCFPNGFQLLDESLNRIEETIEISKKTEVSLENFEIIQHFVMTDEKSIKRYCSTLIIYEKQYIFKGNQENFSKVLPKMSMNRLVNNPLALQYQNLSLIYVPKALCLISRMPIFDLEVQFLKLLHNNVLIPKRNSLLSIKNTENNSKFSKNSLFSQKMPMISLGLSCISTNSSTISTISRKTEGKSKIFTISNCKKVKETRLFEFYSSMIFSILHISDQDQLISYQDLNKENPSETLRFQINNSIGLNIPSFDFWLIFSKLSIENIIRLFTSVLLEKQIIIFSKSSKDLINISETLLNIISPLIWGCIYIPFLPIDMWETLHAMMPFIIGIDSHYKHDILNKINTNDKVLVDLDLNIIEEAEISLHLPSSILRYLKKGLYEILKKKKNLKNLLKTKQIFLNSMYLIINNIKNFFISDEEFHEEQNCNSSEIFNFEAFFELFTENSHRAFMEEFTLNTMMFNKFIEDCFSVLKPDINKDTYFASMMNENILLDDASYFLQELDKIMRNNPSNKLDIEKNPSLFSEIIQSQNLEIMRLLQKFHKNPPENRSLLPYYLNYMSHKTKKTQENKGLTIDTLNKSLEIVPKLDKPIDILKPKSPVHINKVKLEISTSKTRKKPPIHRLASYENSDNREDFSPNSKLISKIKHYYVYYHAIKRNETFKYKRPTNTFRKKSPVRDSTVRSPEKLKKIIEMKDSCLSFEDRNMKNSEKMTPFFKEFTIIAIPTGNNNNNTATNPQDSSCEVTPITKTKPEPVSFSKWLIDNSIKNVQEITRIREDFKDKAVLDTRFVTRSLSPKKRGFRDKIKSENNHY